MIACSTASLTLLISMIYCPGYNTQAHLNALYSLVYSQIISNWIQEAFSHFVCERCLDWTDSTYV